MKAKITPEEYSSILQSISLENISLVECFFKIFEVQQTGGEINLKFDDKYSFTDNENMANFNANFSLIGEVGENNEKLFSISGKFVVAYLKTKQMQITKDFFDVFKSTSLPVFVWPYFREHIQNMVVRSGLPPFTLPARIYNSPKKEKND